METVTHTVTAEIEIRGIDIELGLVRNNIVVVRKSWSSRENKGITKTDIRIFEELHYLNSMVVGLEGRKRFLKS